MEMLVLALTPTRLNDTHHAARRLLVSGLCDYLATILGISKPKPNPSYRMPLKKRMVQWILLRMAGLIAKVLRCNLLLVCIPIEEL